MASEVFDNIQEVTGSGLGDTITLGNNTTVTVLATVYNGEIVESAGNNTLVAGAGRAEIYGGSGNDTIIGGPGADCLAPGGGKNIITGGGGADNINLAHSDSVTSTNQINYAYGDGADTISNFLQGSDSFNFSKLAGYVDPTASVSQVGANTDVHVNWYSSEPVAGEPPPSHVDADIILNNVHLTTFVNGTDYHILS